MDRYTAPALSHEDACLLSRVFNSAVHGMNVDQEMRINEFLKSVISASLTPNEEKARKFGELIPSIVAAFGGSVSTGLGCASIWFDALERGEFGPASPPLEQSSPDGERAGKP